MPVKKLNWTKTPPAALAKTVWSKVKDDTVAVDEDAIVELFAAAPAASPGAAAPAGEGGGAETGKKPAGPTIVSLLDMQRANNVGIMLSRIKMPFAEIREALLAMDDAKLGGQALRSIAQFAPTQEEVEMIREYQGDRALLGSAERFFLEISQVPNLATRLQTCIFKESFSALLGDIEPELATLETACKEVRTSGALLRLLEVILAVGNLLNGGSFRGGAYGFKLDCLLKLADTKAADRKTTLLTFLVHHAEKKVPGS